MCPSKISWFKKYQTPVEIKSSTYYKYAAINSLFGVNEVNVAQTHCLQTTTTMVRENQGRKQVY